MASGLKTVIRIEWLMTVARDCLWATSFAGGWGDGFRRNWHRSARNFRDIAVFVPQGASLRCCGV